jgi:hypothetical protein
MDAVAKDLMSCKRPTFDFSKSAFQPASDRHPQASRRVFDRYLLLVAGQTIFVNEGVARGTWWSQGGSRTPDLLNAIFNVHMSLTFLAIPRYA